MVIERLRSAHTALFVSRVPFDAHAKQAEWISESPKKRMAPDHALFRGDALVLSRARSP